MSTIELRNLRKSFGQVQAVNGLNLTIEPGEIVAFLGLNGAGKTTTIDMILGLTTPTSGEVRIFGTSPREAVQAGRVGALLQSGGLLRDLSVRETVRAIAALQRVPERVQVVMERARLEDIQNRKVSKCSGGQQQRIKFALALLSDPDLLVLDEPTTGMDVSARHHFWEAMAQEADGGRTILFATHYLEEAEAFANRIVLIGEGRLLADGTVAEVQAMSSGRQLSVTFDRLAQAELEELRAIRGVLSVEVQSSRLTFQSKDTDSLARELLARGGRDLTISAPSLETTFMTLTKEAA